MFKDVFAVEGLDDREAYGEDRFTIMALCSLVYTPPEHRLRLISADEQPDMSKTTTTSKTGKPIRPMTDEEVLAAALSDPDAQPLTPDDFRRMKRTPRAKIIRRALGLTQEEFATRFQIPLGTLRDWEQGAAEPDQAARSYLKVIARNPEAVRRALRDSPKPRP